MNSGNEWWKFSEKFVVLTIGSSKIRVFYLK